MEETQVHRHETSISPSEWEQYQLICKHPDIVREPKQQTAFLIRQFIKKHADKISPIRTRFEEEEI